MKPLVLLAWVATVAVVTAGLWWLWSRPTPAQPLTVPARDQAIAAATFDALMQLDCDQPDVADTGPDDCTDELQNANTAPTVLSVARRPGGLWRVVLQFRLSGGGAPIPIAETVT